MITWFKDNPIVVQLIVGIWAFFSTAATLILGVSAYQDSSALDRLEAREKLDSFMIEARNNYHMKCVKDTQSLRPIWQLRYNTLVDVAKIDTSKPPYNSPCKRNSAPNAPVITSMSTITTRTAVKYPDWKSFISTRDKKATLWVGDVPFEIDVSNEIFTTQKEWYNDMLKAIEKCESKEQSKVEYTFARIDCIYSIGDDNNLEFKSYEITINK